MSGKPEQGRHEWESDKRDLVADSRDAIADQRDVVADARDVVAGERDQVADAREVELRAWEDQLEARALRLGLVPDEPAGQTERQEAAAARERAAVERTARRGERLDAASAREDAGARRAAQRRDTLLAAAFAGIAEHLHESPTAEQLLTRVAEAAVTTIAGSSRAVVTRDIDTGQRPSQATPAADATPTAGETSLSFPFDTSTDEGAGPHIATLRVFAADPATLDQAAQDIGFILAAHASLAAHTIGERARLERLIEQLEQALQSRDVIGQAKGILMERLKTTPEGAFQLLTTSSQLLNTKLREVAATLTDTGELPRRTASRTAEENRPDSPKARAGRSGGVLMPGRGCLSSSPGTRSSATSAAG